VSDFSEYKTVERSFHHVEQAILGIFPNAEITGDDDGFLVIKTYCMFTGKNGQNVIGTMVVDGNEPSWD
jgi:hypothetical protein